MTVISSTGHRCYNSTMPKVAATLVVVLLVLGAPAFSSARYVLENLSSVTPTRGPLESNQLSTVTVHMMHVEHVDSPYKQPNLTLLQRAQNAAKRSKDRLSYFSRQISGRRKTLEVVTSPVHSNQVDYVMQFSAGTPARNFAAFVDTGSDLVWLQCTPCSVCYPEPDPRYDPTKSSTYTPISCSAPICVNLNATGGTTSCAMTSNSCLYQYGYGDGSSTTGSMAFETFTLAAPDGSATAIPSIAFGCGTDQGGENSGYDGLIGLGGGPLSLVSQLGSNIGPVFSYCLVSYASAATKTSPLIFGSAPAGLSYTPLINNTFNPTFYYVNLVGITVNDQPVNYPSGTFAIDSSDGSGGLILDSGTTISQLFVEAYTPFKDAISALITYPQVIVIDSGLCYDTSSVSTPVFPVVVFQFQDGVNLSLPSDNVFQPIDNEGTYCLSISSAGSSTLPDAVSVFGNVQQQNFQIAYDIVNVRVGFAPTTC